MTLISVEILVAYLRLKRLQRIRFMTLLKTSHLTGQFVNNSFRILLCVNIIMAITSVSLFHGYAPHYTMRKLMGQ